MTKQGSTGAGPARADGLIDHLVGFREELARSGYGPLRSGAHLELFADLCGWLEHEGVALSELGTERVAAFLDDRRRRGQRDLVSRTGVRSLVGYLTGVGAIPGQGFVVPEGPGRPVLERYRHYLETERGLTAQTVERYVGWRVVSPPGWSAAERSTGNACGPGMSRVSCWAAVRRHVAAMPPALFPPCGRSCGSAIWRASSRSG